jgi:hypothetical protein
MRNGFSLRNDEAHNTAQPLAFLPLATHWG